MIGGCCGIGGDVGTVPSMSPCRAPSIATSTMPAIRRPTPSSRKKPCRYPRNTTPDRASERTALATKASVTTSNKIGRRATLTTAPVSAAARTTAVGSIAGSIERSSRGSSPDHRGWFSGPSLVRYVRAVRHRSRARRPSLCRLAGVGQTPVSLWSAVMVSSRGASCVTRLCSASLLME